MNEINFTSIALLLLRNLFTLADKSFIFLAQNYKLLEFIRCSLISTFLFFLHLLLSLFPPSRDAYDYVLKPKKGDTCSPAGVESSEIYRAFSQVLTIVNEIPVSSRKYELVRSLAEKLIDDNLLNGGGALSEVNCKALTASFWRTIGQLEAAMDDGCGGEEVSGVLSAIRYCGDVVWRRRRGGFGDQLSRSGCSAEKLAAELLWLAEKMEVCGCVEEAVYMWASASRLAWLALSAEPRLQGSLVKVSAFLIKQARDIGKVAEEEESIKEHLRRTNLNMLVSWLPLLCRASNGTDAPVLSISERSELETALEQIIKTLDQQEQEKVLALWLHHFAYFPSSDWPDLHGCYNRWCTAARNLLLFH